MSTTHPRRAALAAFCAAVTALILAAAGAAAVETHVAAAAAGSVRAPIVTIDGGAGRGVAVPGGYAFRGLPYAAVPTGRLRWRAPRPPAEWSGVRDATQFAPSCPQQSNQTCMRTAWANFAANGDPSSAAIPWPSFNDSAQVLSVESPQPQVDTNFVSTHHCSFWAAG